MNQKDIAAAGLRARQVVDLVSHFEGEERIARRFVVVPYDIPQRCAATYFPEANVLVPVRHVAAKSNTPASKSVVISIRPAMEELEQTRLHDPQRRNLQRNRLLRRKKRLRSVRPPND